MLRTREGRVQNLVWTERKVLWYHQKLLMTGASAKVPDLTLVSDNLSSPFMLELTEKLLKKRVGERYM